MAFVSALLGRMVTDVDGQRVGAVKDVLAVVRGDVGHPEITALAVNRESSVFLVPVSDVAALVAPTIPLYKHTSDLTPYAPVENELWLARDILDKQIIDTDDMRVVRVNDLEMARVMNRFYITNVDIGTAGLLRRLGIGALSKLFQAHQAQRPSGMISWDNVELLPETGSMRLKVPSSSLSELHPADLAEIISDLSRADSTAVLQNLDIKTVADTLEAIEPDFQASLVENMADEKVADVLEEMAPDEAADLLAELPEDRSEDLLELMEPEQADDVRMLLKYPEDSAGGIMTTDYVIVNPEMTAAQVTQYLREEAADIENITYIYVVDDQGHLVGVFSLHNLVLAAPEKRVADFMDEHVVSCRITDEQDEVAQLISKYNLLAVPVVDDQERMTGIVTADDALDKVIPTAWKKRLPRLYH
ncbi:MAG: CBS domain-containing protein [Chloroflexi bacterium]|nr:CBS domain-containing protein [Chloroflexota bacterium]